MKKDNVWHRLACGTGLLLYMFLFFNIWIITAEAASIGMETCDISAEEKTAILDTIDLQVIQVTDAEQGIHCFDVSQNHTVALGFDSRIYVYDANGEFRYGFRFQRDGAYGIAFHGEQLTIFFLRGNVLVTFDSTGNCVDIQKAVSTEKNHVAIKELLNRTEKEVAGKQYSLERNFEIGDSYARLIMKDEVGTETILYDASSNHSIGQIALIVFVVGFFLTVIRGCISKSTKEHSRT
jgi:hypothetical protein